MSESLNHTSNLLLRHHRPKWVILFYLSLVVGRFQFHQFSVAESTTNCQFLGKEMETTSSVAESTAEIAIYFMHFPRGGGDSNLSLPWNADTAIYFRMVICSSVAAIKVYFCCSAEWRNSDKIEQHWHFIYFCQPSHTKSETTSLLSSCFVNLFTISQL